MISTRRSLIAVCLLLDSHLQSAGATTFLHLGSRNQQEDGAYLVQFKEEIGVEVGESMLSATLEEMEDSSWMEFRFRDLFHGVSLRNVSDSTVSALGAKDFVQSVALVRPCTPVPHSSSQKVYYKDTDFELDSYKQDHPLNWGLDRIDQQDLPLNGSYHYKYSGLGTEIYVVDTGLYMEHQDFAPVYDAHHRAERTVNCGYDVFGGECNDEVGHGTYVAGIAAGTSYGVAKKATVFAVKVHSHTRGASVATVLKGFEYVFQQKQSRIWRPMVINFSLSGPKSKILNKAVDTLTEAGVAVVVSAGNRASDSCKYSPASSSNAIVVSATNYQDRVASYANTGPCVMLYAPGHQIPSSWVRSRKDKAFMSGTSGAAAHVTGGKYGVVRRRILTLRIEVVAQYLQAHRDWKWEELTKAISAHATEGIVENELGAVSGAKLLHNGDVK